MTIPDFLSQLQHELEFDSPLYLDTEIKKLDEWDSMAAMILFGFIVNNFDVQLSASDLADITTMQTLVEKIGIEKFS